MSRPRKIFLGVLFALIVATLGHFYAFKTGRVDMNPDLFASLVGATALGHVFELGYLIWRAVRRLAPLATGIPRATLLAGVLLVAGGGMTNWLFSLQGYMILTEGTIMPLFGGHGMQELEAGIFADANEMGITLQVAEVEMRRRVDGAIFPEAEVRVRDEATGEVTPITLRQESSKPLGNLWFHLGSVGYTPRIVVTRGDETVYDKEQPFMTRIHERGVVRFEEEIDVPELGLYLEASVNITSLDPGGRGHPTLDVRVHRGEELLGGGNLKVGHFASLGEEFRVGFAGVKQWAEIDISRKSYPGTIIFGMGLAAVGGLAWPTAALVLWVRRRRTESPAVESSPEPAAEEPDPDAG